ncbi:hypothetical protein FPRO04_04719 [Fusarium proliferatum]|nr:hypothetical protein FPRO04_04719 [Fusarium proliferatum]
MLSSNVLRALALFAAAVNAGPCRPSTTLAGTTTEVTSTATVVGSTTDLSSTTIESATETETTNIPTTTTAIAEESTTTTAIIEESTTTDIPTTTTAIAEESTTTDAASTPTTAAVNAYPCSTSDDCAQFADLCLDGLLNICYCDSAECVPQL